MLGQHSLIRSTYPLAVIGPAPDAATTALTRANALSAFSSFYNYFLTWNKAECKSVSWFLIAWCTQPTNVYAATGRSHGWVLQILRIRHRLPPRIILSWLSASDLHVDLRLTNVCFSFSVVINHTLGWSEYSILKCAKMSYASRWLFISYTPTAFTYFLVFSFFYLYVLISKFSLHTPVLPLLN